MTKVLTSWCLRCCLLVTTGLIAACGNYQAPISEQGRNQVVRSPEIISSNAGNEQSRVAPQTSTPTYSSNASDPRIQISSSSDRPATVVSTPETTPVNRNSITRRAIGQPASSAPSGTIAPSINRTPIGGSSAPLSSGGIASSAPGSTSGNSLPGSPRLPSLIPGKHIVRAGDTLFSIAFQYDLDFRTLAM
ncbi:MAG: LysM domain-containing protein, partial [Pseudomonadales bacterium]|nr:LysM domain-containing protein [Pseudomonadales bacterium]